MNTSKQCYSMPRLRVSVIMLIAYYCCFALVTAAPTVAYVSSSLAVVLHVNSRLCGMDARCRRGDIQAHVHNVGGRYHRGHWEGRKLLSVMQSSSDPENTEQDNKFDFGREILSSTLSRRQLLVGGWGAALGVVYVGATQDQSAYRARKRKLFRSITTDQNEFR